GTRVTGCADRLHVAGGRRALADAGGLRAIAAALAGTRWRRRAGENALAQTQGGAGAYAGQRRAPAFAIGG
ncbi:MAG: hypothetical protein ACK6DR_04010, partial [Gemmatimonas sp.]|uniref:hypothetical protein n=1 Tax=Gemmatimonas sp. TaxID=1962908 RepID=UPI00391FA390